MQNQEETCLNLGMQGLMQKVNNKTAMAERRTQMTPMCQHVGVEAYRDGEGIRDGIDAVQSGEGKEEDAWHIGGYYQHVGTGDKGAFRESDASDAGGREIKSRSGSEFEIRGDARLTFSTWYVRFFL